MIGLQVLFYMILAFAACIYSLIWLPLSYSIWSLANWLLFACASWDLSGPRYVLVIFPIFIMFADIARKPPGLLPAHDMVTDLAGLLCEPVRARPLGLLVAITHSAAIG